MNPVDLFLLVIAAIFVIGVIGEIIFEKTDVPDVVWLILVGILIGPVLGWVSREGLVQIAPYFGALTLVIVRRRSSTVSPGVHHGDHQFASHSPTRRTKQQQSTVNKACGAPLQ